MLDAMKGKVKINKRIEFADDNMKHGENYAFYHRPESQSLPPRWYKKLIESAQRSIEIWDPYFNYKPEDSIDDSRLFGYLRSSLKVRYLAIDGKGSFEEKMRACEPLIGSIVVPTLKTGMDIQFGYITTGDDFGKYWEFHDRLLIIDNVRFFLIGSSIGYHLESKASTGIYELKDNEDQRLVREMFDAYWAFAQNRNQFRKIAL